MSKRKKLTLVYREVRRNDKVYLETKHKCPPHVWMEYSDEGPMWTTVWEVSCYVCGKKLGNRNPKKTDYCFWLNEVRVVHPGDEKWARPIVLTNRLVERLEEKARRANIRHYTDLVRMLFERATNKHFEEDSFRVRVYGYLSEGRRLLIARSHRRFLGSASEIRKILEKKVMKSAA